MKTLNDFLNEAKVKLKVDKVHVREARHPETQNDTSYKGEKPIGWFANKHNMAEGWVIFPMDAHDKKWFKEKKEKRDMVFRVANRRNTTLVQINLKTNRMRWFDNAKYVETDDIHWDKQWYTWDRLVIDNTSRAFDYFNTDGIYRS